MQENGIDALYCVGTLSQEIAKAVRTCSSKTEVHHYEDKADLIKDLVKEVQSGDTVLVKASQFYGIPGDCEGIDEVKIGMSDATRKTPSAETLGGFQN